MPLLVALERRVRAGARTRSLFGLGWVAGFVFYVVGIHWIALLSDVAITVPWLKYPAWVMAAVYLALFAGVATALAGALSRRSGVALALVFPAAWLAVEELRASGELGFPWFQPGYTQHAYVPVIQLAALGSVTLVTLWLLAVNVLLWRALAGRARGRAALGAVLVLAFPWAWGWRVLEAGPPAAPGPTIALVQGNIAGEIKWSGRHQREILDIFERLTLRAAAQQQRPALAIWPETATGSYLAKQLEQRLAVSRLAHRTAVPVFSGFADYAFDSLGVARHHNAAGLFLPDGSMAEVYAKRHLVPFGERMPFQALVPALGRLELGQAEWTPGERSVLFTVPGAGPFACLVCFESIFPDLSRADVRAGADWLVNVTNDEWFGNSAALTQHAAMAVFRAVENGVPLARCANTGLTLVADARGRVVARLPVFQPDVLVAALPPRAAPTPFSRLGDWPGLVAWIGVAVLVLLALRRRVDTPRPR